MAITKLNSLAIPPNTIVESDLSYPLTNFSSTGIDDNATSTAITIDSSENVGIGTTSPDGTFHVKDAIAQVYIQSNDGQPSQVVFGDVSDASGGMIEYTSSNEMAFKTNNLNERMRIDSSGNVGIGTTSPSTYDSRANNLVVGDSGDAGITIFSGASSNARLVFAASGDTGLSNGQIDYDNANDKMSLATAGSDRMHIDSSGNVLVGTTDGAFVNGGGIKIANATAARLKLCDSNSAGTGSADGFELTQSGTAAYIYQNENDFMAFGTNATERMRIDASGRVCIGTTSGTELLNVAAGSGTGAGVEFAGNGTTVGTTSLFVGQGTANEAYVYQRANSYMVFATNSVERMRITAVGQLVVPVVYSDTTSDAANVNVRSDGLIRRSTSSRRYKNSITDATHGLTELLALRSVTYKGNSDGDRIFGGLIAEEVHEAGLAEFVQYDSEGNPDALAYGPMTALCVKAIQEQQAMIDELKAEVAALKGA